MNKEEIIKEVIAILETSDYVDSSEQLYDGIKQIKREITYSTILDFRWALESPTVLDVDGKVTLCAKKIKLLLKQELLDEAYENYTKTLVGSITFSEREKNFKSNGIEFNSGYPNYTHYTQEEFINKCKTDQEFSERWGLKIEERELDMMERWKIADLTPNMEEFDFANYMCDKHNVPTKLITVTYNDKTIESYEINGKLCYCGNPVDTSNPDCVTFNLCKEHQMDV